MNVAVGAVRAFYLFDVGDTIDLRSLRTVQGEGLSPMDMPLRPHASTAYLQFPVPPLVTKLPDAEFGNLQCSVRAKFFDYGVISLRFSFNATGPVEHVAEIARSVRRNDDIAKYAAETVERIVAELGPALDDPHKALVEDYFVIEVERFDQPTDSDALVAKQSETLAQLLLAETGTLSKAEIEESLRTRFSYFADDLTIVQWDTAFVYDRRESCDAIADILEFANSQLLELRTYDEQLDGELDVIYAEKGQRPASSLRYLIVDVLELMDRSSNALKVVGDAYYARIYRAAAARLGLADWQKQIDSKLESVRGMYQFLIDQQRAQRDTMLEVVIIGLIAVEIVIGVLTLVRH